MEKSCDNCGNKNKKDVCFYTENVIVCPEWKPIEEEKMCESCKKFPARSDEGLAKRCIEYAQWEAREEIQDRNCEDCVSKHRVNLHTGYCIGCSEKRERWFPHPPTLLNTQQKIDTLFENFKAFLKEKNKRYGDSALKPQKIFSKQDSGSQICNRIDDKLGRIKNSDELKKNDISDLFGYVALLLIENDWLDFEDLID